MGNVNLEHSINTIIKKIVGPNVNMGINNSLLIDISYRSTYDGGEFTFFMGGTYKNLYNLGDDVMKTINEIMTWCDLTEIIKDFTIKIETPHRNFSFTYFEYLNSKYRHKGNGRGHYTNKWFCFVEFQKLENFENNYGAFQNTNFNLFSLSHNKTSINIEIGFNKKEERFLDKLRKKIVSLFK
jgi:hypothetical protein